MNRTRARVLLVGLPLLAFGVGLGCLGQGQHTYFDDLLDGSADVTTAPVEASPGVDVSTGSDGDVVVMNDGAADGSSDDASAIEASLTDADAQAVTDAGPDAPPVEAGCGPTTTVSNCGACGTACDTAHSSPLACTGANCSYSACTTGWGDCDASAPNTNGCETPLTTAANCRACGAACDTQHSIGAACGATGCTYMGCAAGWSMCTSTAPNLAGCACNTPSCCVEAGACQTIHDDGFGHKFYDCTPVNTWVDKSAREACAAYTGNINACTDALTCTGVRTLGPYVCNGAINGTCDTCWSYGGTDIGKVANCQCPTSGLAYLGTWN
jgi:hypothetical protein